MGLKTGVLMLGYPLTGMPGLSHAEPKLFLPSRMGEGCKGVLFFSMCNNGDIAIMLNSCEREILPYCLKTVPVKICTYFILIPNKNTVYAVQSRPLHPCVAI